MPKIGDVVSGYRYLGGDQTIKTIGHNHCQLGIIKAATECLAQLNLLDARLAPKANR